LPYRLQKKIVKHFGHFALPGGVDSMGKFLSSPAGTKSLIEGLKSSSPGGKEYTKRPDVLDEIQWILPLHHSLWGQHAPKLKSETVVFLMRLVRRTDEHLFYVFFQELCARIVVIARRWALRCGANKQATEDIVDDAQVKVLKLVLAEQRTRQGDFLEIAFGMAVQSRTVDRFRAHQRSTWAHLDWIEMKDDVVMDDGIAGLLDLTSNDGPSPEVIALTKDLIEKGLAAVDDPRIRQALLLHFYEEWPIWSNDPDKESVARHFGVTRRQAKRMIEIGLQLMRSAIGETK
jgi:hypothetical protein